ncbi:MAG: hypothetical protein KatS3mg055_3424 [Chloroflexus sp.]|uniref:RNA-guided endonuclease InsQ/TnpB family protein n=1 Tax=Chloroflexus sp. TaxID=1904827 RepID=UPI0021DC17E6|nr:transposase [Chloroflexus sp.]GIV90906.1 MAG: hypothetical protein KatS3mg055_3424 [Chloroflexus sp.]
MKTFVSKLRPTPAQAACLSETVETCRQLYNHALSERKTAYRERGESIGFARQCASLPMLKREVPHLQRVHSQVVQDVVRRVDRAFQAFFRRVKAGEKAGYPRCKGQGRYDSFTYPQWGNGVKLERDGLSFPKSALFGCTTIARLRARQPSVSSFATRMDGTHISCVMLHHHHSRQLVSR